MDRAIEVISTFTTNLSWSTFISPRALLVLMGGAFILIQNTTARLFTFVARVLFYEFLLLLLRVLLCHARQTVRWGGWHQKGYSAVRLKISGSTSWTRFSLDKRTWFDTLETFFFDNLLFSEWPIWPDVFFPRQFAMSMPFCESSSLIFQPADDQGCPDVFFQRLRAPKNHDWLCFPVINFFSC